LGSGSKFSLGARVSCHLVSGVLQSSLLTAGSLGHNNGFHPTYRGFKTWLGLPYSGDMGCLDSTPQACKPSYSRKVGQPSCPALCPPDASGVQTDWSHAPLPVGQRVGDGSNEPVAIPLFDSTGPRCSGHVNCSSDITQQPFNPFALNHRYAERAGEIFARFKPGSGVDAGKPFLLYVAFAHTHVRTGLR
jgi:arylsulfatase G